jgi:class 3 adenylate cyclase
MSKQNIECAILFADVAGSTRLYETLGDAAAQSAIAEALSVLTKITNTFKGTVVKTIGDEIMSRFSTVDDALQAACVMQDQIKSAPVQGVPLAIRIGLHYGPAILDTANGDVHGDGVNLAARMAGIAKAHQVITTGETVDRSSPEIGARTRVYDRATVKGKAKAIDVYEVLWGQEEDVTRLGLDSFTQIGDAARQLQLRYQDRELLLKPEQANKVIGRGQQCDLPVEADLASRAHCRLEYSRGKFMLVDQSTNGTFVRTQDGKEVYLRREGLPLWGKGIISLGKSVADEPTHLIHFLCQ